MNRLCEEDLRKVVWVSEPVLSPDGETALYVRAVSDYRTGKNIPALMAVPVPGGTPRRLCRRTSRQDAPAFSRDGRRLAYLVHDGPVPQVWVMDWATGEERQATRFRWGAAGFAWGAGGALLALMRQEKDSGEDPLTEMTEEEFSAYQYRRAHAPRVTEKLMYKLDEAHGFLENAVSRLCLVDADDLSVRFLTDGRFDCALPYSSPDGRRIYYFTYPNDREKALRPELYCLGDGGAFPVRTDHPARPVIPVRETARGLVFAGEDGDGKLILYLRAGNGEEEPFCGMDGTEGVAPAFLGNEWNGRLTAPVKWDGRDSAWVLTAKDECAVLTVPGLHMNAVQGGFLQDFSAPVRDRVLFIRSTFRRPAELWVRTFPDGKETQLTHENDWLDESLTGAPERVSFFREGGFDPGGWALLPEGDGPCPAVLYVHGGPECFYAPDIFFFEAQTLRAAGFAVLWCNPRGSAGHGPDYRKEEYAFGQEAVDDLNGFVSACLNRFTRIDPDRVGVTGGSYGGYMTNKLTLLSGRFRAAAAQRTWINPATSYGTGDMGFLSGSGQSDFEAYLLRRARGSILRDIQNLNTPTLILHGEEDVRCGAEQGDQLFTVIRALRPQVPCRLVIFPKENHDLTRTGLMHNRIRHMTEIRRWMEKYLKEMDG